MASKLSLFGASALAAAAIVAAAQTIDDRDARAPEAAETLGPTAFAADEGVTPESYISPSEWMDRHGAGLDEVTLPTDPQQVTVETGALFLRATPAMDADILRVMKAGKRVVLLDADANEWTRAIDPETGAFGWVSKRFFEEEAAPEPPQRRARAAAKTASPTAPSAPVEIEAKPKPDDYWNSTLDRNRIDR